MDSLEDTPTPGRELLMSPPKRKRPNPSLHAESENLKHLIAAEIEATLSSALIPQLTTELDRRFLIIQQQQTDTANNANDALKQIAHI